MSGTRLTPRKRVLVPAPPVPFAVWNLQPTRVCQQDGRGVFFADKLWYVLQSLGYHDRPTYEGRRTPMEDGTYLWEVEVTLFQKPTSHTVRAVLRSHKAPVPRVTFEKGIDDAAYQALTVLRAENPGMSQSQFKYYPQRASGSTEEIVASLNAEGNVQLREHVRYSKHQNTRTNGALDDLGDAYERIKELERENRILKAEKAGEIEEGEPLEEPEQDLGPSCSPSRQELRHA